MHSELLLYLDEAGKLLIRVSVACKGSSGLAQLKLNGEVEQFSMDLGTCEQKVKIKGCIERCCCTP